MFKKLQFKSSQKHYQADACIVWCFDDRFSKLLRKFTKDQVFKYFDLIKIGGGAKALADKNNKADQKFVVKQIQTSLQLHHPKTIILMTHSDCGAYGGLAAFGNNQIFEQKKHCAFLREAKKNLQQELPPSVKIKTVFADFNGLKEI